MLRSLRPQRAVLTRLLTEALKRYVAAVRIDFAKDFLYFPVYCTCTLVDGEHANVCILLHYIYASAQEQSYQ